MVGSMDATEIKCRGFAEGSLRGRVEEQRVGDGDGSIKDPPTSRATAKNYHQLCLHPGFLL